MAPDYALQLGFNQPENIRGRLQLFDLSDADLSLGRALQKWIIAPAIPEIVDSFYQFLDQLPTAHIFLNDPRTVRRLRAAQSDYLMTLGINFNTEEYFDRRLQVGLIHAKVGLPTSLYLAAYCQIATQLQTRCDQLADPAAPDRAALKSFVHKIIGLDTSLAIDTYNATQLHNLEDSLDALKYEESLLRQQINMDSLTGLWNRSYAVNKLARAIQHAHRDGRPLCVIMADLDHFKQVNDHYGHIVGDEVLTETAARIKAAVREHDIVGRYGGEEFLIVLSSTSLQTAFHVAERVRTHVSGTPMHVRGTILPKISISLGVHAVKTEDSVESAIALADAALYQAKRAGRNTVVISDAATSDVV